MGFVMLSTGTIIQATETRATILQRLAAANQAADLTTPAGDTVTVRTTTVMAVSDAQDALTGIGRWV